MAKKYRVIAQWDAEAAVWMATSDDIPGLVSEAPSLDALYARVIEVAPELLEDNGVKASISDVIDFHVFSSIALTAAE